MYGYRLQGLLLASDRVLPGLKPLYSVANPDVVFHSDHWPTDLDAEKLKAAEPTYTSPYCDSAGEPFSRMWRCPESGVHYFRFGEGLAFAVDSTGKTIWARWRESFPFEGTSAFLLGQILAFVLRLRGYVCLHASAVAIEGAAVLFGGAPGMGKSSTAAALSERGYPVLTDDVAAIRPEPEGRFTVMPGVPRMCLRPDSVEFLYGSGSAEKFPRLFPAEEKRAVRLDAATGKYYEKSTPLEAIYLLAPRSSDATAPRVEAIPSADRLIRLLYNGFMHLALDEEQTACQFRILGEIARHVRTRQLVPSRDPRKLGRLCDLVLDDMHASSVLPGSRSL